MSTKIYDVKARICEHDNIALTYLQQILDTNKSGVIRIALNKLLEDKVFIEDFSFCEIGYNFKNFEGVKTITSSKHGFLISLWNEDNYRYEGNIAYKIYIPYKYLNKKFRIKSYEDYENLCDEEKDDIHNFIAEIRSDIEEEIFNYLETENLVESIYTNDK